MIPPFRRKAKGNSYKPEHNFTKIQEGYQRFLEQEPVHVLQSKINFIHKSKKTFSGIFERST